MADAIFISYRRDDSEGESGRLFDDLTRAFGDEAVFMDVAGIKPGLDFRKAIEDHVASCGVLLAIIGPEWISLTSADGTRRLDNPNDFVALEIASAMKRGVPVIPVLVHDAKMPSDGQLPDAIKNLAFRNGVELSHARWNSDVSLLIEALKAYVNPVPMPDQQTVHATVPVQLPGPHPPEGSTARGEASKSNLYAGLAFVAVLVVCVIAWQFLSRSHSSRRKAGAATGLSSIAASPSAQVPGGSGAQANREPDVASETESGDPHLKNSFVGTWKRTGAPKDKANIVELEISLRGKRLAIQAAEAGGDQWPRQPGELKAGALHARFFFPGYPNTYALKISAVNASELSVTETATTPDGTHSESDRFTCTRESLSGNQ